MATLAPTGNVALATRESRRARDERLFRLLPELGSPEYLSLLKSVVRKTMPAGVLVRAYRRLGSTKAADATITRLVDRNDPPGYIARVCAEARRRRRRLGAYTVEDLEADAVGEILATIDGPTGRIAEGAWALFLQQCIEEAYRALVGRGGSRLGSHAASGATDGDDDDEAFDIENAAFSAWRTRFESSCLEWLEPFIERTVNEIEDPEIRAIGLDLFSETPMRASSKNPRDPDTLAGRFGVTRMTIHRWQNNARAILYDALDAQSEYEIDLSFLEFGAEDGDD